MTGTIPEFVIDRTFAASPEFLWKAWTKPEVMARWWGPKGVTVGKSVMDLRVGGTYHYSMVPPGGAPMWGKFIYREIDEPRKLVFESGFSDENGGVTRHPFAPTWPLKTLTTITFENDNGKTKLTIRWVPEGANEVELKTFTDGLASMQQGWSGTLDQLEAFLSWQ